MSNASGNVYLGNRPELNLGLSTDDNMHFIIKTEPLRVSYQMTNPLNKKMWGEICFTKFP